MGSTIDFIECPRCSFGDAVDDFYYKTGEEYIYCPNCGYHMESHWKRNPEGTLITIDGTTNHNFDNLVWETKVTKPYGSYTIEYCDRNKVYGSLEKKEDYQNFVLEIKSKTKRVEKPKDFFDPFDEESSYVGGDFYEKISNVIVRLEDNDWEEEVLFQL